MGDGSSVNPDLLPGAFVSGLPEHLADNGKYPSPPGRPQVPPSMPASVAVKPAITPHGELLASRRTVLSPLSQVLMETTGVNQPLHAKPNGSTESLHLLPLLGEKVVRLDRTLAGSLE